MEEGVKSGQYQGTVVKSRNSSGCLIVRKKGDVMSGVDSLGPRKVFKSKKEKKRARLMVSDSGSIDELLLDPYCGTAGPAVNLVRNGSGGFDKGGMVEETESCGKNNRGEHVKRELVAGGSDEVEVERKRSRLDVFEFDEYDGIDGDGMKNEYLGNGKMDVSGGRFSGLKTVARSGGRRECETESSRHFAINKRKPSLFDSSGSLSTERKSNASNSNKNRFKMRRGGDPLPDLLSREKVGVPAADEAIRLQGRNGVLKVMANKKNKVGGPMKSCNHCKIDVDAVNDTSLVFPSSCSETKSSSVARAEKDQSNVRKVVSTKKSMVSVSDSEDSDTSLKLEMKNVKACSSIKRVKSGGEATTSSEKLLPTRCKEGKVNRGSGTEKQLLREQIKKMLISAGWTIDYRPRRNRDYLDAVYINPTGSGYWSIVKAYDALQKQQEDEDNNFDASGECSPFTPISEEALSKLTRQTQRKIEKEMKRKRRDAGYNKKEAARRSYANAKHLMENNDSSDDEDKLCSFIRQSGKSLKGRLREVDYVNGGATKQDSAFASDSRLVVGRKSREIGRCTLLVRRSNKGQNSETDGFVPYTGKRTLLSWMIDSRTVQLCEKVQYMNRRRTQALLEGWITRDGIHCKCCSKILTVSKFEIHAGSKIRQPFQNIFLESGISLLQCQLEAWNKLEESKRSGFLCVDIDGDDPNDDTCGICGDGGDLICCDGCPSTFHLSCLHIQLLPPGDWHCPNCSCKFCGVNDESFSQGNDTIAEEPLLKCRLCEKKYHDLCASKTGDLPLASRTLPTSFCGQKCRELYERLQKFLGVKHELEAGFSWSLIHRTDPDLDTSIRGFPQRVECNSKIGVAMSIMDECFLPIVDRRSGINLIHNVLYNCGSNFSRLDYSGFYTAILERGDEIISAASIRIHGTQLAEMPFIGTRHVYRRQGMFRRLFCAIQSALSSLKVEKIILPAISDLMRTWTIVFGFNPLEELHKQEMRSLNMLVFPDTDMLQKPLLKQEMTEAKTTASTGAMTVGVKGNHCSGPDLATKSDMDSSVDHEPHVCNDAVVRYADGIIDKVSAADSGVLVHGISSNGISVMMSSSDAPHELKVELCSDGKSGEKVAESASDGKFLSSFHVGVDVLETEKPVLDSTVEGNSQSPANYEVRDAPEGNVKDPRVEPVPDCLGEICSKNSAENISAETNQIAVPVSTIGSGDKSAVQVEDINQNAVSVSTCSADESMVQSISNVHCWNALEMESKFHVASQAFSDETHCEERASTAEYITEDTDQIVNPHSTYHGVEESTLEINQNSDSLHEPKVRIHGEGNVCLSSQSREEIAESASDWKCSSFGVGDDVLEMDKPVPNVEGAICSLANHEVRDAPKGNVEAACIEPLPGCLGEVLAQDTSGNISEETNHNAVPVSTFHTADESTVQVKEINQKVLSASTACSANESA